MPAKIDPVWRVRVFDARARQPRLGADRLRRELVDEWGEPVPGERWIRDAMREYDGLSDDERREHDLVRWPDHFGGKGLPWESASVWVEAERYITRISVRHVRWLYRLTLTFPNAPVEDLFDPAWRIAAAEAIGDRHAARGIFDALRPAKRKRAVRG